MIARESLPSWKDSSNPSGVLLALLELSTELDETNCGPEASASPEMDSGSSMPFRDPGGSSVLLESLHRDWAEVHTPRRRFAEVGRTVSRYRLIERLGRGNQGEVWKAIRSEPVLEMVALKVLSPDMASDPARRARFLREAALGKRLAGPMLLPTYESGEADGALFLAMPLVEGTSLSELIAQRRSPAAAPRASSRSWWSSLSSNAYTFAMVQLIARVARAVESIHNGRVVHRDIKPANILVDRAREDRSYLCDFGMGLDLSTGTRRDGEEGAGTPLYMAPEKLRGRAADEFRCDVYSLGVTLFEAVTLSHPFPVPRTIPQSCLPAYLLATLPPRPREVQPWLPRGLESIILRAMAHDPAWRYPTAGALASALEHFLTTGPGRWLAGVADPPKRRLIAPSRRLTHAVPALA